MGLSSSKVARAAAGMRRSGAPLLTRRTPSRRCRARTAPSTLVSTGRPLAGSPAAPGPGLAELGQRNARAATRGQDPGLLDHQAVMRGGVAPVERVHGAIGQGGHEFDAGRKLRRHGLQRGREAGDQTQGTLLALHGLFDHGLVGLEHGQRRVARGHGLNAGAKGRAGEQDPLRTRVHGVLSKALETLVHGGFQPAPVARQVGREAVAQQVHANRLGPVARKGFVDGSDGVAEGVDEGDAGHGLGESEMERNYWGASRVNWERGSRRLKSASKLTTCSPWWMAAAASQASGTSLAASALSAHSCLNAGHSAPSTACSTPGDASNASMKRKASAMGVGLTKIFGCVTRRRKLATTMGCNFSSTPWLASAMACSSQSRATE